MTHTAFDLLTRGRRDTSKSFKSSRNSEWLEESAYRELITDITQTRAFRRLTQVRFLGALDYALVRQPNGRIGHSRYTRAQHSLGVARLASAYADAKEISPDSSNLCVASAMLHDIGHAPFSHSIEPAFRKFGLDHHLASAEILEGRTNLSSDLVLVLEKYNIDVEALIRVISGHDEQFDGFFSGPINFDTIEGILRASSYVKSNRHSVSPDRVLKAAVSWSSNADVETVDEFWKTKHDVYNLLIRSPAGVFVDTLFCKIVSRSEHFVATDFFSTESVLFQKYPLLRQAIETPLLHEMVRALLPAELEFQKRNFWIDESAPLGQRPSARRYRQDKEEILLTAWR